MKVAVVIPTLDEERLVGAAIESVLKDQRDAPREGLDDLDVVVADGGSQDATRARARAAGARVVESEPGRSRQLNAGLVEARGDVVLFLHADSRLPAGWSAGLRRALKEPGTAGGAFRLGFEGHGFGLRVLEWGVGLRMRLLRLPYGDQALFVRRSVLDALGGVPEAPIMEDLDLAREICRRGGLVIVPLEVMTSARRYEGHVLRHMLRNWLALAGWRLGLDRARLAACYGV